MTRKAPKTTDEKTIQLAIRLPAVLIERIDAHARRLRESTPGVNVTRADAHRALLLAAVERVETDEASK
jgi:hypothetical protein